MPRYLIPAFVVVTAPDDSLANAVAAEMCEQFIAQDALDGRRLRLCEASHTTEIPEDEDPPHDLAGLTCDTLLLVDGVEAAQAVVDNWESGDLAGAVNVLEGWINDAEEHIGAGPMPMEDDPPPACGHSACRQNWGDTGEGVCVHEEDGTKPAGED